MNPLLAAGGILQKGGSALTPVVQGVASPFLRFGATANSALRGTVNLTKHALGDKDALAREAAAQTVDLTGPQYLRPALTAREAAGTGLQLGTAIGGAGLTKGIAALAPVSRAAVGALSGGVLGLTGGAGKGLEDAGAQRLGALGTVDLTAKTGISGAVIGAGIGGATGAIADRWNAPMKKPQPDELDRLLAEAEDLNRRAKESVARSRAENEALRAGGEAVEGAKAWPEKQVSNHLYHTTPSKNLTSIGKEGLVTGKPSRYPGISSESNLSFSASEEGTSYYGGSDDVLLRVKPEFAFDDLSEDLLAGGEGNYLTGKNVPPEMLEVKQPDGSWKALVEAPASMGKTPGAGASWKNLQEQKPELFNTGILRRSLKPMGATDSIPEDVHALQGKWQNYGQMDEIPAKNVYDVVDNYGYYLDKDGNSISDLKTTNPLKNTENDAGETVEAIISNQQLKNELLKSFSTKDGKTYLDKVVKALPKNPDGTITAYRIGAIGGKGPQSYTLSEGMAKTFSNQGTDIMPSGLPGLPTGGYKDFGVLPVNQVKIDPKGIVAWSPYDAEILVEPKFVKK